MRARRSFSILLLAALIVAALVFRRFAFVAFYPVVMSAAVAAGFGLSLFRRKTLCEELAENMPPHILPEGASAYCRRLTWAWFALMTLNGLVAFATVYAPRWVWVIWNCALSYLMWGAFAGAEWLYRRHRFAVRFHTSGSTAAPKTIVKPFAALAREVAYHHAKLTCLASRPVFIATVEPSHMFGTLWFSLLARVTGAPAVQEVLATPEALFAHMRASEKVFLITTPSFLARLADFADQYEIPQNAVEIVTSGALLTPAVSAAAARLFGRRPLEIFGSTETGGVAWRRQDGTPEGEMWTVFDPVRVRTDREGRLVVTSPFSVPHTYRMGDAAELAPDGRHLRLLGRRDRLVKIAEERVSLPEMEERMRTLPEIADVVLGVVEGARGPQLGAVIVPSSAALAHVGEKRALARELRQACLAFFPRGTVPRRYRFVAELPRNAQGKIRRDEVTNMLTADFVEPFARSVKREPGRVMVELVFPADAPYFKGHFPDCPVLPGVVELGVAKLWAERLAGAPLALKTVKKLKFMHVVRPQESVELALAQTVPGEFSFTYRKGEAVCASGVLVS